MRFAIENREINIELKRVLAILICLILSIYITNLYIAENTEWKLVDTTIENGTKILTYEEIPLSYLTIYALQVVIFLLIGILEVAIYYFILKPLSKWIKGETNLL